ncbi:MAG: glycosyltransferase family 39 protein [Candidatus Hydrogenedentes bacterium]|nr:glycosyltransferase family 39 protein [Candidatus Hydrogenedentota bacterium]
MSTQTSLNERAVFTGYGAVLAVAVAASLLLGFLNLGQPSLWHDELIHVFVAQHIAETGQSELPSGTPYHNGTTFNLLLAFAIRLWGVSEAVVRSPSVLIGALNVLLVFFCVRPLLGRRTALIAAVIVAVSPWTVAWAREARFYSLQQGLYLTTILAFWYLVEATSLRRAIVPALVALVAYGLAILTSFHSILFLGGPGAFVVFMWLGPRRFRSRWTFLVCAVGVVGVITLISLSGLMNALDRETILDRGGLGGELFDVERSDRGYYVLWLRSNLSIGFYLLALLGTIVMLLREGRKGLYASMAFWIPLLLLTFAIGYRRPRFMFFAFPFYVAAFSYAIVVLTDWCRRPKRTWLTRIAVVGLILFAARLTYSAGLLVRDSLRVASGASTTLARHHPQWRGPCEYVRENRGDAVVLTTTYLPVLYYVGHMDNWYPSRTLWWEEDESGLPGLPDLEALKTYVAEHPKGYFIAHWWRFERNTPMADEVAWVNENMTRIDEASNEDVTVWTWGTGP